MLASRQLNHITQAQLSSFISPLHIQNRKRSVRELLPEDTGDQGSGKDKVRCFGIGRKSAVNESPECSMVEKFFYDRDPVQDFLFGRKDCGGKYGEKTGRFLPSTRLMSLADLALGVCALSRRNNELKYAIRCCVAGDPVESQIVTQHLQLRRHSSSILDDIQKYIILSVTI